MSSLLRFGQHQILLALVLVAVGAVVVASAWRSGAANGTTIITVDSTADGHDDDNALPCTDGSTGCTLRAAIDIVNAQTGPFTIAFGLDGCPCTITPGSLYDNITADGLTIDGRTQPSYAGTPLVTVDGVNMDPGSVLSIIANEITVRGMHTINGGNGIWVDGNGTLIEDNVVTDAGNQGIRTNSGPDIVITNNTVEDSVKEGIYVGSITTGNREISSNSVSGSGRAGIYVTAAGVAIGGNAVNDGHREGISAGGAPDLVISNNIVSGNAFGGIVDLDGDAVHGNMVTDNGFAGISAYPGALPSMIDGNTVTGNGSGSAPLGVSDLENSSGIYIGADGSTVTRNTIEGNASNGVVIQATGVTVGGGAPLANTISGNGGAGIYVADAFIEPASITPAGFSTPTDNTISANSVFDNQGLGIDLDPIGPAQNDDGDGDGGSNRLQNYPTLSEATVNGQLAISGALNSRPQAPFRIEFFVNVSCDPSTYGQGEGFLGFAMVNTDVSGHAAIHATISQQVPAGSFITATATHLGTNDTSEFSACVEAQSESTGSPTPSGTPSPTTVATSTPVPSGTPVVETPTPTPTPPPSERTQGDNDCDEDSDAVDALVTLQFVAGLDYNQQPGCPALGDEIKVPASAANPIFGDVDCDGDVDAVDALAILRNVAGLNVVQNDPCPKIGEPL